MAVKGTVRTIVLSAAETLFPGYFALAMATGVVSIASSLLGMQGVAWALLVVNWIAYPSLWGLTLVRVAAFWHQLAVDISEPRDLVDIYLQVASIVVANRPIADDRDELVSDFQVCPDQFVAIALVSPDFLNPLVGDLAEKRARCRLLNRGPSFTQTLAQILNAVEHAGRVAEVLQIALTQHGLTTMGTPQRC